MYDKNNYNKLSQETGTVIYVYDTLEKRLFFYNGTDEKAAAVPPWIASMAESGSSRKLFQKDGKPFAYYCLNIEGSKYAIFQDDQDGSRLNTFVKSIAGEVTTAAEPQGSSPESEDLKKELIKAKTEQAKLRVDVKQRDNTIQELQTKIQTSDIIGMQKTIKELTEANAEQYSQIRRMKSDTDQSNFQKLKQINKELREEISEVAFKSAEAEDRYSRMKKALEATLGELMRLLELTRIEKADLKGIISKIPINEFGVAPAPLPPEVPRKLDIDDIINALNAVISSGDTSTLNIDKLASVVSISDKEGIKRSPSTALKSVIGTLIGMSKAARISPLQMNTLADAVGVKK